jgi:hypothetical protein
MAEPKWDLGEYHGSCECYYLAVEESGGISEVFDIDFELEESRSLTLLKWASATGARSPCPFRYDSLEKSGA